MNQFADRNDSVGLTHVRMLLNLTLVPNNPGLNSGTQIVDVGVAQADLEAFVANALPDANVEGDYPSRGWWTRIRELVENHVTESFIPAVKIIRDLKILRKIVDGEPYIQLTNTANTGTSGTVLFDGTIRNLWRLP